MKKEKKYFLDTSFIIDLIKKRKPAIETHKKIKGKETTGSICIYELAKHTSKDLKPAFKNKEILPLTAKDAQEAGKIHKKQKKKGQDLGETDTIIAGIVKNRNLILVTRDTDFQKIPEIEKHMYNTE